MRHTVWPKHSSKKPPPVRALRLRDDGSAGVNFVRSAMSLSGRDLPFEVSRVHDIAGFVAFLEKGCVDGGSSWNLIVVM